MTDPSPLVLPPQLTYGTVVWTAIGLDTDTGSDPDDLPDVISINGTGTIVADVPEPWLTAPGLAVPLSILLRPMDVVIVNGRLYDKGNNREIKLVANDCPALSRTDFSYTISYELNDNYSFGSFPFEVKTGERTDLSEWAPMLSSEGTPIVRGPKGDPGLVGPAGSPYPMVVHGDDPSVARPNTSDPVFWFGTVDPINSDDTKDVMFPLVPEADSGGFEVIPSDSAVAGLISDPLSATSAAQRAAFGRAAPVLSDFVYDAPTGNLLSYKEDGIPIVLTYNADGTVATSKRGDEPTQTYSYSGGNLVGVA